MGFPATNTFQSATGPVDVTVTAHPETGHPHMVHFSTDAGLCAHFLVREWNQLNTHLAELISIGKGEPLTYEIVPNAAVPKMVPPPREADDSEDGDGAPQGAPVTPDQPFLPPTAEAAEGGEDA